MLLNHANVIPQPLRNFVDANSCGREQAGEGVPRDMWRDPRAILFCNIFAPRSPKIPPIPTLPAGRIGMEHEGRAKLINFQKRLERLGHRYRPILSIFRTKCVGLANVDCARFQIEPIWSRLDDFLFAHSGVKSAEEREFKVVPVAPPQSICLVVPACRIVFDRYYRASLI